jgi:glutamate dehydrogenase (NAD(P)+)
VAVADLSGAVVNEAGLDVERLVEHVAEAGGVEGFEGAETTDKDEIFSVDCDVLIPAAAEGQITAANAHGIGARIIAEGANGPTTPAADEMLNDRGTFVIPDILCNAGGVFVSYLEYTQETQREQMPLAEVEKRLEQRMRQCFRDVYDYSRDKGITMRGAAMDLAVGRVVEAIFARGFLP